MQPIIEVQNLSKQYRLGTVGTGSIKHDVNRWWYRVRGKEDPYLKIGETNDRTAKGSSEYVWALRDINFSVQPGEVLGIIGRNGAGKSTLLKILSRITTPTTGSITMRGRVASLLEVGTGMHPELTGRENIYLNGAILGMRKKEIDRKFDEIVDFAAVERYIDTPVKRYSSGMHVRLGFAVAAHLEPDILIVDEVLAVGDLEFQKKCIGKMKQVSSNDGRTIFFVSHNMDAIQKLCPKSMVMSNGLISFIGKTSDTISHYIKEYQDFGKFKKSENIVGQSGIVLKSFELKNIEGEAISNIRFGQDWLLELKVEFPRAIQKGRIGLGILSETEIPLRTIFCEPQDFLNKDYTFSINLGDIWLSPGTYLINLGFSENEVPIDFFGIIGYFQVIELNTQIGNNKLFRITSTAFVLNTCKIDIT